MKKKGLIETIVTVGIVAAGIGGTLYLLKDKMEEDPKWKESIDKVKNKVKKAAREKEESFDESDLFDEDFDEIIHTSSPASERGYVNIKLSGDEDDISEEDVPAGDIISEKEDAPAEDTVSEE